MLKVSPSRRPACVHTIVKVVVGRSIQILTASDHYLHDRTDTLFLLSLSDKRVFAVTVLFKKKKKTQV